MINIFGEEEFKQIVRFGVEIPNYFISKDGRIYSQRSNIIRKPTIRERNGRVDHVRISIPIPEGLLSNGYDYRKYGSGKNVYELPTTVHRAVMETWRPIDEYPPDRLKDDWDNAPESFKQWVRETALIDHIDDDPTNNHVDNLRWVTPRENCPYVKHKFDEKRKKEKDTEEYNEERMKKRRDANRSYYHRVKKFKPQTEAEKARKRRWYEKNRDRILLEQKTKRNGGV